MEEINCIFCNVSTDQVVIEENGYRGKKCPECGLIYISPRPLPSEIQDLYAQDKSYKSAEEHISGAFKKRLFARHNLRVIKKYISKGSMLEIGAGAGFFLEEAQKSGFDVHGIELNPIQADFIRTELGIPCEEVPLNGSSFTAQRFDIIYHCDVISHFYDPVAEFKKMNNALVEQGIMVFETGNLGDIKEKYYRFYPVFQYPDHLFFFSENNIRQLLKSTGFELVGIYRYSLLPQLWTADLLRGFINSARTKETGKNASNIAGNGSPTRRLSLKQLLRNGYHLYSYLARYKAGAVMPKAGRPQTMLFVARKSNGLS